MKQNRTKKDVIEDSVPELEVRPLARVNEYYIDISNKFKTAKYAVLVFLVLFVLCMISIFRNDITLENCEYLLRFLTSEVSSYADEYEIIYYDTAGVVDVEMFNGNLVTVKNNGIDFYDVNGNNTESLGINQSSPVVVTAGKHMLIYDLGGYSFNLFNNFSQLTTETYNYPISCAAISEEGMYAVVTKSLDYQSIVHLYDHNYNLITKIYKDKYITDIKIDRSGEKLLFTSFYAENGGYKSEIVTYVPYTEKESGLNTAENSFATMCDFHDDGSYSVLTDRALLFYNDDDKLINQFNLGSIVPNQCMILDNYVALAYNQNIIGSESELTVFDTEGNRDFVYTVKDKILDWTCYEDQLYLLLDSALMHIDLSEKTWEYCDIEKGAMEIYMYDNDTVVTKYSNMAKAFRTAELFAENKEEN